MLASRLRRGERGLRSLQERSARWLDGLRAGRSASTAGARRTAYPAPARSPFLPDAPLRPPLPIAPGRPRRSAASRSAENQRLRIMFATADDRRARLQSGDSIAEITRAAGVDARAFYALFADKRTRSVPSTNWATSARWP